MVYVASKCNLVTIVFPSPFNQGCDFAGSLCRLCLRFLGTNLIHYKRENKNFKKIQHKYPKYIVIHNFIGDIFLFRGVVVTEVGQEICQVTGWLGKVTRRQATKRECPPTFAKPFVDLAGSWHGKLDSAWRNHKDPNRRAQTGKLW